MLPFKSLAMIVLTATVCMTSTVSLAQQADGKSAGDWLIRGRAIAVVPDESSTVTVIGGEASVNDAIMPELDFSYFFYELGRCRTHPCHHKP